MNTTLAPIPTTLTTALISSHSPSPQPRAAEPTPDAQSTPNKASFAGRCYQAMHPVQACNLTSLVINALAAAGGILGGVFTPGINPYLSYGLYGIGGLASANIIAGGCNTFYLRAWRPKKTLEQTIDISVAQVQALKARVQDLVSQNETLSKLQQDLNGTLTIERQQNTTLTDHIHELEAKLRQITEGGERLQESLNATLRLKNEWQTVAQNVARGSASFDTEFRRLAPAAQDAEASIGTLQQLAQAADLDLDQAQALAAKMEEARSGWISILKELYQNFASIHTDLEVKARQIEEQKALITDLEATNTKLTATEGRLMPMLARFQAIAEQYTQAQARFAQARVKLECLNTIPEGATIAYIRNAAQEAMRALQP